MTVCLSVITIIFERGFSSLFDSCFIRAFNWASGLNNTPLHSHYFNFPGIGDTLSTFKDGDELNAIW